MKREKIGGWMFVLLALVAFVSANNFNVIVEPIIDEITVDQTAKIDLTITNLQEEDDFFKLTFDDVVRWDQYTKPLADYFSGMEVKAGESYTTSVHVKPLSDIGTGFHDIQLKVSSENLGKTDTKVIPLYIKSLQSSTEYAPSIRSWLIFPEEIDPREDYVLKMKVENRNRRNINELEIRIDSKLFSKFFTTSLGSLEKKEIEIPVEFDDRLSPQSDEISVTLTVPGFRPLLVPKEKFVVIDYTGPFKENVNVEEGFLSSSKTVKLTNDGNRNQSHLYSEETTFFTSIFKSESLDYSWISKQDGVRYRVWDFELSPGESVEIKLKTNYRMILYLLVLIIVLVLGYYFLKSPITLTKHAKNVEMREGGISEVKVILSVKNGSANPIHSVTVSDVIPYIASLNTDFEMGTIKPTKVMRHGSSSKTVVHWNIDELDPFEDRLITYRIRSKLPILGQFKLPVADVKYTSKSGKRLKINSNQLTIH